MEWRRPGGAAASWIGSAWLLAGVLEVLTGAALSRTDSAGAGPADRNHTRRPRGLVRFARFTGNGPDAPRPHLGASQQRRWEVAAMLWPAVRVCAQTQPPSFS